MHVDSFGHKWRLGLWRSHSSSIYNTYSYLCDTHIYLSNLCHHIRTIYISYIQHFFIRHIYSVSLCFICINIRESCFLVVCRSYCSCRRFSWHIDHYAWRNLGQHHWHATTTHPACHLVPASSEPSSQSSL